MATITPLRKGADGYFAIERFTDVAETIPINLDDLIDIRIYLYTSPLDIKKFAKVPATGYTTLTKETAYKYSSYLLGSVNKLMKSGNIIMEIWNAETNGQIITGYKMVDSLIVYNLIDDEIKAES